MKVIAMIKTGPAAAIVLGVASRLAALLGADAEAVHVLENDNGDVPRADAAQARIPLKVVNAPFVAGIVEAGSEPDVVALVLGPGGVRAGRPHLGKALEVTAIVEKPVVVVPLREIGPWTVPRVLVALDDTGAASAEVVSRAVEAGAAIMALDVLDEDSLPLFTDQAEHEFAAWSAEHLARHFPGASSAVRLEVRIGDRPECVVAVAQQTRPDVVVLGLDEAVVPGQCELAQTLLETCGVPVTLVPVQAPRARRDRSFAGFERRHEELP